MNKITKFEQKLEALNREFKEFKKGHKLQLEDHNFRVNSDGWTKGTDDGDEYLVGPKTEAIKKIFNHLL